MDHLVRALGKNVTLWWDNSHCGEQGRIPRAKGARTNTEKRGGRAWPEKVETISRTKGMKDILEKAWTRDIRGKASSKGGGRKDTRGRKTSREAGKRGRRSTVKWSRRGGTGRKERAEFKQVWAQRRELKKRKKK